MSGLTLESRGEPAELLLVEDNYGDMLLMLEAFQGGKVSTRVSVAVDGEQAMSMLRREGANRDQPTPDLILLDFNLPRMDAREVLQAIKTDASLRRIPVIVLTSSDAETDIAEAYELRANAYIVKPAVYERLQEVVAAIEAFWFTTAALSAARAYEQAHAR
jgi:CheY-like chemotaxis protein